MRLVDRIKDGVAQYQSRCGKRPVYLIMSAAQYRLLLYEAGEWLVKKPIYELEMYHGCYIVVGVVADFQLVGAPWEHVRFGE